MADSVPSTKIKDVQQVLRDVVNLGEWVCRLSSILIDTVEPESLVSFRRQEAILEHSLSE